MNRDATPMEARTMDSQTERQKGKETERQTDRKTERQKDTNAYFVDEQ